MSEEKALLPIEQRDVEFYGDPLTAVLVQDGDRERVYIPIRPICDFLGVAWPAQRLRINRDPVLSEASMSVIVTITDIEMGSRRPHTSAMLSLPLEYLNGWLFGINATRVKEELRARLIQYQKECYQVLATAFSQRPLPTESPNITALTQIREMGLAIVQMAEQQIEFERRIGATESRLDRAAVVVGELGRRVSSLERRLSPGSVITDEQAAEVQTAVHALGLMLTEQDKSKNQFQSVFHELHRRFGVSSYKLIPQDKYAAVLTFLQEWRERASP